MKRTAVYVVAWIALMQTSNAPADDAGLYLDAALGLIDTPDTSIIGGDPVITGPTDDNDWSWAVGAGYRFNKNIALELGYLDLGKISANLADASGATDATGDSSFEAEGTTFALVGSFPMGRWEPYLKAGVLFSRTDLQFQRTLGAATTDRRVTADNEDPLYGAGVRFTVTQPLQVYLDLTYFDEVGEPETGQSSYLNSSLGILWRF